MQSKIKKVFSSLLFLPLIVLGLTSCSNDEKLGKLEKEWYKNNACDTWVIIKENPAAFTYKTLRTDCNKYIKVYRYKKDDYEKLTFLFVENGDEAKLVFDKNGKNKVLTWIYNYKNYEKDKDYKCGCTGATQTACPNF